MQTDDVSTPDWRERPVFRKNQQLTPQRLNRIHEHQATRLRHALLGLAGPGVIYGFQLKTQTDEPCKVKPGCLFITCGLAIDIHGRQLHWPGGWVCVDQLAQKPKAEGEHTLSVHYAERGSDAGHHCGCPPDDTDWIEEGVVFTVTPNCSPINEDCPERGGKARHEDDCDQCLTPSEYACSRLGSVQGDIPPDEELEKLCENPGELCHAGCDDWLYDANAGLPLACVKIVDERKNRDCDSDWGFSDEQPKVCEFRPHVYRNPLLQELLRGCHLHLDPPRVSNLSFSHWLDRGFDNPVAWHSFATAIKQGLSVWFSKPIKVATLNAASVFVSAVVRESDTFFQDVWRMPVEDMEMLNPHTNDEGVHLAKGVTLKFNEKWIDNQIDSELSRFNFGALIEFTVRGSMLRDECDSMLDSRPIGIDKEKLGHVMLGDDFVVAFCVAHRPQGGGEKRPR